MSFEGVLHCDVLATVVSRDGYLLPRDGLVLHRDGYYCDVMVYYCAMLA